MPNGDVAEALRPVAKAFAHLGVPFYVGGCVASSFHGAMRSTMDVDLVADLSDAQVSCRKRKEENRFRLTQLGTASAVPNKYFSELEDPRFGVNRLHLHGDVIVIAICGMLADADGQTAIGTLIIVSAWASGQGISLRRWL